MIKNLKSLIAFILLLSVSQSVWCQTLYVTLSDSHSNYDNLVKFLQVFESKVENFKVHYPQGQVVLLINGDYAGASGLASVVVDGKMDAGAIGNNTLKLLAESGVQIIFNSGNHEAHDFAPVDGNNRLYIEQMKDLKSTGDKVALLGTNQNFLPETGLDQLFAKHFDVIDKQNGTNRVLGLTLQTLETKSSISPNHKLFSSIDSYEVSLSKHIEKAIADGISHMTVMIHEETPIVTNLANALELKYRDRIQFNAWIAGHDHREAKLLSNRGTPILNAGSQFGFMDWQQLRPNIQALDVNSFLAENYTHWDTSVKRHSMTDLAMRINRIYEKINSNIQTLKKNLMSVHHGRFNIIEGKLLMKKAHERVKLGMALANSMKAWSQSEMPSALPTIGIFNTSSYRVDRGFGKVDLTDLHIVEMYPFYTNAKIHKLQGSDVLEILQRTIVFQENINAVQLSSNLRVLVEPRQIISAKDGLQINIDFPVGVEIFDGQWRTLQPTESIMAGVDDWTTINGYKNKYESKYLKDNFKSGGKDLKKKKNIESMLQILQVYLPQELRNVESLNISEFNNRSAKSIRTEKYSELSVKKIEPVKNKVISCKALF